MQFLICQPSTIVCLVCLPTICLAAIVYEYNLSQLCLVTLHVAVRIILRTHYVLSDPEGTYVKPM
jgi:hypothetical protein